MASSLIRFRRGLNVLSGLHQSFSTTATPFSVTIRGTVSSPGSPWESPNVGAQSRSFRSSSISLLSGRFSQPQTNIPDEIDPDTILFEGCDYNHWLITINFPKDNTLTPEEKVRIYEETCAKGLNISVEEAKKKMYACSTTTYEGFQAVMTEEESKKFEGLPGVVFVLPDSYIDPVNKEYGGDKDIDGTIIPRPPPVQYGRNQGGRYQGRRDWNRGPDQYNQQENPMANPRGNPSYNNRGSAPGDGRNYGPQQGYPPQQNYGQAPQQGNPPQQNYGQAPQQGKPPQQNYGQAPQPGYLPQETHGQASQSYPPKQNYGQASQNYPPQQNFNQASQNYPPQQSNGQASPSYPPQQSHGQVLPTYPPKQNFGQASQSYPPQQNFNQASQNYSPPQQTYGSASPQYAQQQSFGPPGQSERRNFAPQQNFGPPGQGVRSDPVSSDGGWNNNSSPMWRSRATPSALNMFTNALRCFSSGHALHCFSSGNALRCFSSDVANTVPHEARERMMYSDINSQIGSCMPLSAMRIGTIIHNIELNPGQGGKLVRAAGTNAKILKDPTAPYCLVQLPSGVKKMIDSRCRATIGTVSNPTHGDRKLRKAGHSRWLGRRPVVRGIAMNPVDHPHGGGEGKSKSSGGWGKGSRTPWGKPTKGGFKTGPLKRRK